MIFDTPEQKNYVIQCVSSCREWTHQQSLQLSNQFDRSIQQGHILPLEEQPKAADPDSPESTKPAENEKKKLSDNGNKKTIPEGAAA